MILSFLKAHWLSIVLSLALASGVALFQHNQTGWAQTVSSLNAAHQVEVDKITQAQQEEEKQHAEEVKALQDTLTEIQTNYATAQAQLQKRQTAEAAAIVSKYGKNVGGLTNLFAQKMGFTVVAP